MTRRSSPTGGPDGGDGPRKPSHRNAQTGADSDGPPVRRRARRRLLPIADDLGGSPERDDHPDAPGARAAKAEAASSHDVPAGAVCEERSESPATDAGGEDSGGHDPGRPIGYGNPSRSTLIRKGEVRNPHGRKGKPGRQAAEGASARRAVSDLDRVLGRKIEITKDDRKMRLSVREALAEQVTAEALKGDDKARRQLTAMMRINLAERRLEVSGSGAERSAMPGLSLDQAESALERFRAIGGWERPASASRRPETLRDTQGGHAGEASGDDHGPRRAGGSDDDESCGRRGGDDSYE